MFVPLQDLRNGTATLREFETALMNSSNLLPTHNLHQKYIKVLEDVGYTLNAYYELAKTRTHSCRNVPRRRPQQPLQPLQQPQQSQQHQHPQQQSETIPASPRDPNDPWGLKKAAAAKKAAEDAAAEKAAAEKAAAEKAAAAKKAAAEKAAAEKAAADYYNRPGWQTVSSRK